MTGLPPRDAAVIHCLDADRGSAPLRRLLLRRCAAGQRGVRHLEIVIGEGAGSGLPSVARVAAAEPRPIARAIAATAREIEVAAVIAWSNAAGLAIADGEGPGRRIAVLDRPPDRWRERPLRGRGPLVAAAWSAWLGSLGPRRRFGLSLLRGLPLPAGGSLDEAAADARRRRPRLRAEIGIEAGSIAAGLFVTGVAADATRSARHDGLSVLGLALLAGMPLTIVLDPADLHAEGLVEQIRQFGFADRVRTAPLRSDPVAAAALDLALLAGGAAPGSGRPPIEPDLVLLPDLLARAGVCVAAFEQPPWPSLLPAGAMLVPVSPPLAAAQRLMAAWSSPQGRASSLEAAERSADHDRSDRFPLALGGPWLVQERAGSSRSAAPA